MITSEYLEEKGFEWHPTTWNRIGMPFFSLNGVFLFVDVTGNKKGYLIGFGQGGDGGQWDESFHLVVFRWITIQSELEEIYKAILGKTL